MIDKTLARTLLQQSPGPYEVNYLDGGSVVRYDLLVYEGCLVDLWPVRAVVEYADGERIPMSIEDTLIADDGNENTTTRVSLFLVAVMRTDEGYRCLYGDYDDQKEELLLSKTKGSE